MGGQVDTHAVYALAYERPGSVDYDSPDMNKVAESKLRGFEEYQMGMEDLIPWHLQLVEPMLYNT